jgi:(1->4)-alpha-D-glucan 1-alpha-D-glucosylmutase
MRARINVLSEIPERWRAALTRWRRFNKKKKSQVDGQLAPDPNDEYLLYQSLIGAWPVEPEAGEFAAFRQRIRDYMLKAVREAKVNSSWISPNAAYEEALVRFVDLLLQEKSHNPFLADMGEFQRLTSHCGMLNALSQTLLKITAPGIPDFFQGSELWDLSLVDPDNRRPVDFGLRHRCLEEIRQGEEKAGPLALARELAADMRDGSIKLYLIRQALGLRYRERELFERGSYLPLEVQGEGVDHVCAFERSLGEGLVIVVAPRFFTRLVREPGELPLGQEVWQATRIVFPPEAGGGRYRNVFTGEVLASERQEAGEGLYLADVLAHFPVALLERIPHPRPDPPLEGEGGG